MDPDGMFSKIPRLIRAGLKIGWTINDFWRFKYPTEGLRVGLIGS